MAGLLTHRLDGEGEVLLLLNGGMMSMSSWDPLVPRLAERFRVLRCDFRGQLLSPGEPPRTLAGHVGDVVRLLDSLELDAVHVMGTSFGGQVGLLLAATHPRRVRSLIAVTVADRSSGTMKRGAARTRRICREILGGDDPGRLHDFLSGEVYSAAYLAANRETLATRRQQMALLPPAWFEGVIGLLDVVEDFDLGPRLGSIGCPTLVVIAGDDRVLLPEHGRAVAAAIPGASSETFDGCGHALVIERTDELVSMTLAFLEQTKESGS